MATKLDKARVELATAIIKQRTASVELRGQWVQLFVALVKLTTVALGVIGGVVIVLLRL